MSTQPTDDEILAMAKEAGIVTGENLRFAEGQRYRSLGAPRNVKEEHLLRFADMVAANTAPQQEVQEPVAWGAFYFGGSRNGKLYSHCDTQAQIEAYIADRHQSDDSNTFRAAPLYTAPPQRHPHRTVTYVCPVCAASLEKQE